MISESIIKDANLAGIKLTLSKTGTIKIRGDKNAINDWLPKIQENKSAIIEELKTQSEWWQVQFENGEVKSLSVWPPMTKTQMMASYPNAIHLEPYSPEVVKPAGLMTKNEEKILLDWLAAIQETDKAYIKELMEHCQSNAEAREYFLSMAAEATQ